MNKQVQAAVNATMSGMSFCSIYRKTVIIGTRKYLLEIMEVNGNLIAGLYLNGAFGVAYATLERGVYAGIASAPTEEAMSFMATLL